MAPKAGEQAPKTATYYCSGCDYSLRIHRGSTIPPCPCGGTEYEEDSRKTRTERAARRRGSR